VAFSANDDTGDERTSGSAAALAGIDSARSSGDLVALDLGVRRLMMLYGLAFSFGGIPLLYMGDELALANDHTYTDDPAHAQDSRWIHRPLMDWSVAERRRDPSTVEGRVFTRFRQLVSARAATPALRAGGSIEAFGTGSDRVLGIRRWHPLHGPVLILASFSAETNTIAPVGSPPAGDAWFDALTGERVRGDVAMSLTGYAMRWLVVAPEHCVVPAPGPR
jgi:amylosucrase